MQKLLLLGLLAALVTAAPEPQPTHKVGNQWFYDDHELADMRARLRSKTAAIPGNPPSVEAVQHVIQELKQHNAEEDILEQAYRVAAETEKIYGWVDTYIAEIKKRPTTSDIYDFYFNHPEHIPTLSPANGYSWHTVSTWVPNDLKAKKDKKERDEKIKKESEQAQEHLEKHFQNYMNSRKGQI